jgi:hypothetical protein
MRRVATLNPLFLATSCLAVASLKPKLTEAFIVEICDLTCVIANAEFPAFGEHFTYQNID